MRASDFFLIALALLMALVSQTSAHAAHPPAPQPGDMVLYAVPREAAPNADVPPLAWPAVVVRADGDAPDAAVDLAAFTPDGDAYLYGVPACTPRQADCWRWPQRGGR